MKQTLMLMVPTLEGGGQERVAVRTAEILRDKYNVVMVVFDLNKAVFSPSCEVINVNIPPASNIVTKLVNIFRRVRAVRRLKREKKPIVTYSFGTTANLINVLSKVFGKTIVSVRGRAAAFSPRLTNKMIYHLMDKCICVSEGIRKGLISRGIKENKLYSLYNPYNAEEIIGLSNETINIESDYIITCGRLEKIKGYSHLIRAFKLILEKYPNLKLVFIGTGEEKSNLEILAESLKIEKYVMFLGFQENPYKYIKRAKVFVLSSVSEGFPNALVEAMICGKAIVATDCETGPMEIMEGTDIASKEGKLEETKYGYLVPPFLTNDSDENEKDNMLAEGIVKILEEPDRASVFERNAYERGIQFSYERYLNNLLGIFEC